MKIYIFDSWRKFWGDAIRHWQAQGHEVKTGLHWGPELVEWADVAIFHPVDNNLKQATIRQEKPAGTLVIAEAVDIDIYSNHLGGVNWESGYVDALVYYAEHMRAYAEQKFGHVIPSSVPRYTVPGGIDMDRWTLRQSERGCNVAWIGRFWIAKNVFGALQVFHQLIRTDPDKPWRLFLRGDGWHPPTWWMRHNESYLAANPELSDRVEIVGHVPDINEWLEPMDYLLQTSYKEAFGYVVAQAAAKGVRPVIQYTTGVLDIWPKEWVFNTHAEAVEMFLSNHDPREARGVIADRYPLERRLAAYEAIWAPFIS